MKILLVHGIGFHESEEQLQNWVPKWVSAIKDGAAEHALDINDPFGADGRPSGVNGDFSKDPGILYYESLIKGYGSPSSIDYVAGVTSLLSSAVVTSVGGVFGRERGFFDDLQELRWKAEQVIGWAQNVPLRKALRERVRDEIEAKNPDIVVAHSFGGLITYDACLFLDPDLLAKRFFITLGTQVGNPLLRKEFDGYQLPVRCRHWYNLYNPKDKVFVTSLEHIRADNFTQIITEHDEGGGHDGVAYLSNSSFARIAWPQIAAARGGRAIPGVSPTARAVSKTPPKKVPRPASAGNRALLIGIDRYANPVVPPLHGCVNDTFQLSAALQESGIDHRHIRLLHNGRATRQNLLDNISWLLDDAQPGDHRILSFSGHGHRRPTYSIDGEAMEMHEVLCTHDYLTSSSETGLRDRDFQDLYANLPRGVHFMIFLDCCHAGGVSRAGGPAIRSFSGPTDIEHESSRWNPDLEMWEQGPLLHKGLNPEFLPRTYHSRDLGELWQQLRKMEGGTRLSKTELHQKETSLYYGMYGDTRRIGRATPLRDVAHSRYDQVDKELRKLHPEQFKDSAGGPYLPLVFMACGETEQASEYVHGAVSYGAFTYALTLTLRDIKHGRTPALNYGQLLVETARKLRVLGYTQTPDILGPPEQLKAATPFGAPRSPKVRTPRTRAKK
jgi:hypothetical protein